MAQPNSNTSLEKKIRAAILKLIAEGKSVTNEKVRELIGGGSFRDIRPLVKTLKAEIEAKEQAARAAPEMPEDFHDAAAGMWNTAWDLADSINAAERRGHAAQIGTLEADRDDWISISEKLEDERDNETRRADDAEAKLEEANTTIRDREIEIAEL